VLRARRAGCVDQCRQVVGCELLAGFVEPRLLDLFAQLQQVGPAQHAVRLVGRPVDDHDLLQLREVAALRYDLLQLFAVLDDENLGIGMVQDVGAVTTQQRGVDADADATTDDDGDIGHHPLQTGLGQDRDPVALLHSKGEEPPAQADRGVAELGPGHIDPDVVLLVAEYGIAGAVPVILPEELVERAEFGRIAAHSLHRVGTHADSRSPVQRPP